MSAERSLSTKIERPALSAVLARLTGKPPERFTNVKDVHELGVSTRPSYKCIPWAKMAPVFEARRVEGRLVRVQVQAPRTMGAGEALTELYEAGLWSWAPGDVDAPRWSCATCSGNGTTESTQGNVVCYSCIGTGCFTSARSFASQVAVVSLGVPTLRNAYGLAAQLVIRAPRVTFRVMEREALRDFNEASAHSSAIRLSDEACIVLASRESHCMAQNGSPNAWPVECPFRFRPIVAAWPVLRDLAALGLHLVALDGDRVTLAVEALGSDR